MAQHQLPRSAETDLRSIIRELSNRKSADSHVKDNLERAVASILTVNDKASHDRAVEEIFSALLMCVDVFPVSPNIPLLFVSVLQSLAISPDSIDNESSFLHIVTLLHKAVLSLKSSQAETPLLRCVQLLSVLQSEHFLAYYDCEVVLSLVLSTVAVLLSIPNPAVSQTALAGLKQFLIYLRDSPSNHHPYLLVSRDLVSIAFLSPTRHLLRDHTIDAQYALDVLISSGFHGSFWNSDPDFISLLRTELLPGITLALGAIHTISEKEKLLKLVVLVCSSVKTLPETCPEEVHGLVQGLVSLLAAKVRLKPLLECLHDAVFSQAEILRICDTGVIGDAMKSVCGLFPELGVAERQLLLEMISQYIDHVLVCSDAPPSVNVCWMSVLSVLSASIETAVMLLEKFIRMLSQCQMSEARSKTMHTILKGSSESISLRVVGLMTIFANGTLLSVADWDVVMHAFERKENDNTKKFFAQIQKAQPIIPTLLEALLVTDDLLSYWRVVRAGELVEKLDDVSEVWRKIIKPSFSSRAELSSVTMDAMVDLVGRLTDSPAIHEETIILLGEFFASVHASDVLVAAVKDSGNHFSETAWTTVVGIVKSHPSFQLLEVCLEEHPLPASAASALLEVLQTLSVSSLTNPQVFKGISLAQKISSLVPVHAFFRALSTDPRPDVRNCALRTVPSALSLEDTLDVVKLVAECFEESTSVATSPHRSILVHHSRDTARKQWSESVVLGLAAVGETLKKNFPKSIPREHPLLEGVVRGGLEKIGEIADAAIDLVLTIARLHKFDPNVPILHTLLLAEADIVRCHPDRVSRLLMALLEEKRKSSIPSEFSPVITPLLEAILSSPVVYTESTVPFILTPEWNYNREPEPFCSVVVPEESLAERPWLYTPDLAALPVDTYMARTIFPCIDLFSGVFRLQILSLVLSPDFVFKNSGTLHLSLRVITSFTETVEAGRVDSVLVRSVIVALSTLTLTRRGSVKFAASNLWKLALQSLVRIGVAAVDTPERIEITTDVLDALEEYLRVVVGMGADPVNFAAINFCVANGRLCMHILENDQIGGLLSRFAFLLVWNNMLKGEDPNRCSFQVAKSFAENPLEIDSPEIGNRTNISEPDLEVICRFVCAMFSIPSPPALIVHVLDSLTKSGDAELRAKISLVLMSTVAQRLVVHESLQVRSAVARLLEEIAPDLVSRFQR